MTKASIRLAILAVFVFSIPSFAEEEKGRKRGAAGGNSDRIKEALKKFDKDGDGQLSEEERAEAKKFYQSQGGRAGGQGKPGQGSNRAAIMKRFDKNGNGKIDEDEKQAMVAARKEILAKFDKNGNGKIDEEERAAVRQHFMQQQGAKEQGAKGNGAGRFQEIIKRFDKDGDGKLSEEERAAARKFMEENRAKGGFDRPAGDTAPKKRENKLNQDLLKKFDTDGDGELSAEERKAARAARENR